MIISAPSLLSHPKYRPDIDGLRAIAVLSVVAFHAFPNLIKGGFIGVDVFFVISGYLISTIIFENLGKGTFSFYDFYARRITRIFPALLFVLIVSYTFGWFALLSDEYKQLGKHIAAGTGFVSNLVLWTEAGYFDNSADTKPLLHLWSLGIEEQFYIVWPLLLWLAWVRRFNLLTITILVALFSFFMNITGIKTDSVATFYSPQTRFWELLSGSMLAWLTLYKKENFQFINLKVDGWLASVIYRKKTENDGQTASNVMSLVGLLLLAYGFWQINKDYGFPGNWAVVPVLGAVLIILAGSNAWLNREILSSKIAVWFGLISFPLYLWHWPLLSFARIVQSEVPSINIRIVAILLSIMLAWLTYRFIERPIRSGKHSKLKVVVLIVLMTIVGYVGYYTYSRDGFSSRVKEFDTISKAAGEWQYPGNLKPFTFNEKTLLRQDSDNKNITLFIGDSNIEQYYVRIDELISSKPAITNSIVFATGAGCFPIPSSPYDDGHKQCFDLMETALKFAQEKPLVRNIVIGAQWNGYLSHGLGLNGTFGFGSKNYKASLSSLSAYIWQLRNLGKNVFLVLNIPTGEELDPKFMAQRGIKYFPSFLAIRDGGIKRDEIDATYGNIQQDLRRLAESQGAIVIQPLDHLCDSIFCPSVDESGEPMYKDSFHLRPSYVRRNAFYIDGTVISN